MTTTHDAPSDDGDAAGGPSRLGQHGARHDAAHGHGREDDQ